MSLNKITIIILITFFLAGCVTSNRTPLTISARKAIKSDSLILDTHQKKLKAESLNPPNNNMTNAGALPVSVMSGATVGEAALGVGIGSIIGDLLVNAINNAEIHHVESAMKPLSNELKNFNVAQIFKNDLYKELKQVKWLKINNALTKYNLKTTDKKKLMQTSKANTMLYVDLVYKINFKLTAIALYTTVELDIKNPKVYKKYSPIYRNNFAYIYYLPEKVTRRSQALPLWSKNHGQLIRNALKMGAKNIAKQIVKDMRNPKRDLYANMKNQKIITFQDEYHQTVYGKIISKSKEFYVVIGSDDSIYIFNKNALLS